MFIPYFSDFMTSETSVAFLITPRIFILTQKGGETQWNASDQLD